MGLTKREIERKENENITKETKECKCCKNLISLEKYEENEGFCDNCKYHWEKTQEE